MQTIEEQCRKIQSYVVEMREKLHEIPELGIDLPETQAMICGELDRMGIPYRKNTVQLDGVTDSGIVALIEGKNTDKVLALRADMDGLPVREQREYPYKSRHEGRMHACGHDNHVAMLLGAAKILNDNRERLNGSVKLFFQSAEEIITGAKLLIKGGCMEDPKVTACFGMHVWPMPEYRPGQVIVRSGCMMASGNRFVIRIRGVGSHGSQPQLGIDPIACMGQVITALQNISSRELAGDEPRVLSICQAHAGSFWNVVPDEAMMEGTIRTTSPATQKHYMTRVTQIVEGVSRAMRCEGNVDWVDGTPPVMNDEAFTDLVVRAGKKILGEDGVNMNVPASMGNEDFAYYQERVPGTFVFLNTANVEKGTTASLHSPVFTVDEDVLWRGSAIAVQTALDYLA
jgi:amidohydrolase